MGGGSGGGSREGVCPRLANNEGQATQCGASFDAVESCLCKSLGMKQSWWPATEWQGCDEVRGRVVGVKGEIWKLEEKTMLI